MQDNSWKLTFRAWEFALLLVCIVMALFLAYFFGFRAGSAVGYDDAMTKSIKSTPKLSVFEDAPDALQEEDLNQIYAKVVEQPAPIEEVIKDPAQPNTNQISNQEVEPDLVELEEDFKKQQEVQAESTEVVAEQEVDLQSLAAKEIIIQPAIVESIPNQELQKIETLPSVSDPVLPIVKEEAPISPVIEKSKPPVATPTPIPTPEIKKEPLVVATPVPVKPVAKTSFASGWYVQVATSKSKESADKLSKELYAAGFKSTIETYKIANNEFYRVLVGPESQQPYANRLVEQLGREKFLSGKPFIKQIK